MYFEGISVGRFSNLLGDSLGVTVTQVSGPKGKQLIFDYKGYQHTIEIESFEEEDVDGEIVDTVKVNRVVGTFEGEIFDVIEGF